ncbi:MAG: enolase C-terminal domain-like protein [Oscillospiraceae bacterium]|nr:enolase C-terminal domain-like protein [Oscillospiraceae bacterium]
MPVITKAVCNFEIEPLTHPFGFKGGALNHLWQSCVWLCTEDGIEADGLGCENTLWSDKDVFSAASPAASSAMMYLITEYAAKQLIGLDFTTPQAALDAIFPAAHAYAKAVTGRELRVTFVLNALVPVDHALWKLYAQLHGTDSMDALLPKQAAPFMAARYDRISVIPLISYGVSLDEVRALAEEGFFFLKIKIGSDPDKDGSYDKMLAWDKQRILAIHEAVKDVRTPFTDSGHIAYYLDANGRYDSLERLQSLVDYAREIGVLERTVLIEEPFPESYKVNVSSLPVIVAADESAHSPADVVERIDVLGYSAIALKPIAKTMTVTYRMIAEAGKRNIPCFCADLTVGPLMLEVNKSFASRLGCLPGLKLPVVESNGWQNYVNWETMRRWNPTADRAYTVMERGGFDLNDDFYAHSGGMFAPYAHYADLAKNG